MRRSVRAWSAKGEQTGLCGTAVTLGARVTVVDVVPDRLRLAAELGAADTLLPGPDAPLAEQLRDRGVRPAVVYEVVGAAEIGRAHV